VTGIRSRKQWQSWWKYRDPVEPRAEWQRHTGRLEAFECRLARLLAFHLLIFTWRLGSGHVRDHGQVGLGRGWFAVSRSVWVLCWRGSCVR